jgi:hypothetical protein
MKQPDRPDLDRARKLARLPEEVRQSRWAVSITRLTVLKGLCREAEVGNRFVTYLARKALERVRQGKGRSSHPDTGEQRLHQELMAEALAEMEAWIQRPGDDRRQRLLDLLGRMREQQNETRRISWGAVRLIKDWELLLFEYALHCLLGPPDQVGPWAYQTARHYAERYEPSQGTGLTSSSAPLVQDIADFWAQEFGLSPAALAAPPEATRAKRDRRPSAGPGKGKQKKARFTSRQGQFLAFIHLYRKLHRRGPSEVEMARFFRLTPPSVHLMVVKLDELGLITRQPGVARSVEVAVPAEQLPALEDVEGPPW